MKTLQRKSKNNDEVLKGNYLENSGFTNIVWPSVKSMKQTLNLYKGLANIKKTNSVMCLQRHSLALGYSTSQVRHN